MNSSLGNQPVPETSCLGFMPKPFVPFSEEEKNPLRNVRISARELRVSLDKDLSCSDQNENLNLPSVETLSESQVVALGLKPLPDIRDSNFSNGSRRVLQTIGYLPGNKLGVGETPAVPGPPLQIEVISSAGPCQPDPEILLSKEAPEPPALPPGIGPSILDETLGGLAVEESLDDSEVETLRDENSQNPSEPINSDEESFVFENSPLPEAKPRFIAKRSLPAALVNLEFPNLRNQRLSESPHHSGSEFSEPEFDLSLSRSRIQGPQVLETSAFKKKKKVSLLNQLPIEPNDPNSHINALDINVQIEAVGPTEFKNQNDHNQSIDANNPTNPSDHTDPTDLNNPSDPIDTPGLQPPTLEPTDMRFSFSSESAANSNLQKDLQTVPPHNHEGKKSNSCYQENVFADQSEDETDSKPKRHLKTQDQTDKKSEICSEEAPSSPETTLQSEDFKHLLASVEYAILVLSSEKLTIANIEDLTRVSCRRIRALRKLYTH